MMNKQQAREFREKLDEVLATLSYLNDKFDLQYVLNCMSIENDRYVIDEVYNNEYISVIELEYVASKILKLQKEKGYLSSLVGSGRTIVICKDASQKPSGFVGDWIEKDKIYNVTVMRRTKDGFYYELENVSTNNTGFHSSRFQRIRSIHFLN